MKSYNFVFQIILSLSINFLFSIEIINAGEQGHVSGKDHGKLSSKHISASKDFFDKYLKKDGKYNAAKISEFIEHLHKEKEAIKSDIYETVIFERLTLELKKYKKAKKKAEEEIDPKIGEVMRGYKEYLLPKMQKLLELVTSNSKKEEWDGLVDDFARGYLSYYMPNGHRSIWPEDIDLPHIASKGTKPYKFSAKDKNKVEAFNLRVPKDLIEAVRACLSKKISSEHYLSQKEISRIKKCGIDISKFNPGISAFWEKKSKRQIKEIFIDNDDIFPRENEKVIFKKVIYRSRTSPKVKAFVIRNGKEIAFKVKTGIEVHTDHASSKILELVGLNQDKMSYRKKIRIYLDGTSYREMISFFGNKYGIESIAQYLGPLQEEEGEKFFEMKDITLEGRPASELRVSPIDLSSWDLQNRRENRSLLLVLAWLGINDMQPSNCKLLFRDNGNELHPQIRLHDPGASFGGTLNLRKPNDFFSVAKFYRVNAFKKSVISASPTKDEIKIYWNDFANRGRNFENTTSQDLKWMARNILSVKKKNILKALLHSGMPDAVAKIFYIKLLMRRNDMIKVFNLEHEFSKDKVPNLKELTESDDNGLVIKKGKIVRTSFQDKNNPVQVAENWWTLIPQLMTFDIPVNKWESGSGKHKINSGLKGLKGLKEDLNISEYGQNSTSTKIPIGVGIQAEVSRSVTANSNLMNSDGKVRLYKVSDKIMIKIGADSPLIRRFLRNAPVVKGDLSLRFYEKEFEHVHYKDKIDEAYLSKFELIKIISNLNKYAAFHLEPLELIRSYDRYGVEIEAGVGAYAVQPVIDNEISLLAGARKILSHYYVRDQYGQLHYFIDHEKTAMGGFNLMLGKLDLFAIQLPFLNIKLGASNFECEMTDNIIRLPGSDRDKAKSFRSDEQKILEYSILNKFSGSAEDLYDSETSDVNYSLTSKGKNFSAGLGAFFLFNKEKTKSKVTTKVKLPNGEDKYFHRYSNEKSDYKGLGGMTFDFETFDLMVKTRKKIRIDLEMDEDIGQDFVIIIKTEDFYRARNLEKVNRLIDDLNRRYSERKGLPFYRDFLLPPKSDVNKYPKVYALTHIFLTGKKLAKNIVHLDEEKAKKIAHEHFTSSWQFLIGEKANSLSPVQKIKLKFQIKKVMKKLKKLYNALEEPQNLENNRKLAYAFVKLIGKLHTETYGLHFLRELLGQKNIFVMGQITGLLRSFSTLFDLQQLQRRRFMAKSWGNYTITPPLQNFMRKQRLIPPSAHIDKTYSDSQLFGVLETAMPPNLEDLYSHDKHF